MHPEPEPEQHRLAEWWPRVGATLLDLLITWVILLLAVVPAAIAEESIAGSDGLGGGLWLLIALILSSAYYCGTMARKGVHNGQTWGKQAAGIRVMRDDGKPMTLSLAFVREVLLKYVVGSAVLGLGWLVDSLWPLGERENRTLHDLAVRSHVVQTKSARVALPAPPPVQEHLAPEIARHVRAAHAIEAAIRDAVQRDRLPYSDVSAEVGSLVAILDASARRAQMLHQALSEAPVERLEGRLAELEGSGKLELMSSLTEQLAGRRRLQDQLDHSLDELERVVAELDTVRSSLLSLSASTDVANQQRLADQVRGLRDEMSAVAEGAHQAYG